jgi:hypothetical protein
MTDRLTHDQAIFLGHVRESIRESFDLVLPYSEPDDTGGYFSLRLLHDSWLIEKMLLGTVPLNKQGKYSEFSMEKPLRLEKKQHVLKTPHLSSYQSRVPSANRWGGAIIGYSQSTQLPTYAFGFSGLTEYCDEAVNFFAEIKIGCLTLSRACYIAGISKNTTFMKILEQVQADQSNFFHSVCV